jgi:DNA-binding response OmpR family regulator
VAQRKWRSDVSLATSAPSFRDAARTAPQPAPHALRSDWNINVLLVEDDAADTSLILDVLRHHPRVASAAALAAPDIALLQLEVGHMTPDLVLLDIHMPRIDGFQFLTRLRLIKAMASVPVVFLTTSVHLADVTDAKRSSASSYVTKPDSFGELKERLDVVIRRVIADGSTQHDR